MSQKIRSVLKALMSMAALGACSLLLQAAIPQGWLLAGGNPMDYESGIDKQTVHNNLPSAYLKAKKSTAEGFGTLMQDFRADKYLEKRVRLSAFAKTEGVQQWSGLWMRVDKGNTSVAFDNMQDRPIKGTSDWQRYEVVLDVPPDATGIAFGILLSGPGRVWLNSVKFEVVGPEVPPTGRGTRRDEPTNLNFEN